MTRSKVENITQLEVNITPVPGPPKSFLATLRDRETGIEIICTPGRTETIALDNVLKANYQRVARAVMKSQGYRCNSCGRLAALSTHHVIHRSKGRQDVPENCVALCSQCHHKAHS